MDATPNKSAGTPQSEFGDVLLQINFDDPAKKQDKNYGKRILSEIYRQQNNTSTQFFRGRNIQWGENDLWATGMQNMNEFSDYISTEGNKAYTPVDMTPNRTGAQFVGVLIDSMSQNDEYPCVKAVDDGSIKEKEQRKIDALFRMREIETIDKLQKLSGIQLESANAYVPDDELSAEVYFKLEDRLPKEVEFEEKLSKIMSDNKYKQKSRTTKRDLIVFNCAATKIEKLPNGFISIRKCNAPNLIYNFIMSDSGQMELSYIGEVYTLKIKDLRRKYGRSDENTKGLSEKECFDMAATASKYNIGNRFNFSWMESYAYSQYRPYDDYGIEVFDCEVQTFDADYYTSKTDSFGKENITPKKNIPQPTSERARVIKSSKLTWYRGIWAIKSDKMIYWGLPDLTIRPFMNISESLSSYSVQIPNNNGSYIPSLFERGLSPLRKWTLTDLKVKQILANMRPSGVAFDIEQMRDIDLGLGNSTSPMEILKIYNQTGNIPFSSLGVNPAKEQGVPIKELANAGSVQQLQELQMVLDSSMQELRSLWGVPLYRDGSDLPPRMGQGVVENQTANSNNVTDFINFSDKELWDETLYKCCLLLWDEVVLNKGRKDLMDTEFEVTVELRPTAYEKQMLEQNIQIAMKSVDPSTNKPLLSFKDAFKIRNIENYKLAEMYLANMIERNEKMASMKQQSDQQANIQSQQQSAQQAAQAQQQMQQDKIDSEKDMLNFKSTKEKELALLNGVLQIAAKGISIPPEFMTLVQLLVPNIAIPLSEENKEMQQGIEQKDAMEQQEAQAQQQSNGQQQSSQQLQQQNLPQQGQQMQQQPQMQ